MACLYNAYTNQDGQVFGVGNVLHLCYDDPTGLLVVELVRLVIIRSEHVEQLIGDSVVLPNPQSVHHRQERMTAYSQIPCKMNEVIYAGFIF